MLELNVICLSKKKRLNLDLKRLKSEQARISKGSLFHCRGAATKTLAGHTFSC